MGFNVPKEYFTETYSTPINDKEEEPETDPGPETEPTEDNEAGDIENAIKKKTTLATIYDAFTSGIDGHECTNELDYEETPPPKWSDELIDDVIRGIYTGLYTLRNLPEKLYLELGKRITNGLYEGLATGDALTTIANPEYIKNLRNNIYTFSGAKNWQQVNLMSEFLLDADGNKRSFKQYKDFARQTFGTFNVNYLRTEINHAKGSAQMAEKWQQIDEEADIFPFLRYVTAGDERVRPAHQALNGVIKRVDSDFWKENSPLNGWNCRCSLQQVEEAIETPDAEIKEKVDELTDGAGLQTPDYMKNNPGREIFGKEHPYFKVPRGFKADKANNFGLPEPPPITNEEIVKNIKTAQRKIDKKAVVFKPAKTIAEAEEFARSKNLAINVDYSRLSLKGANRMNEGLFNVKNKYNLTPLEELNGNIPTPEAAGMANGKAFIMNKEVFEVKKQGRKFNKNKFNRFSVSDSYDGAKYEETIINHETGHIIADQTFGQINGKDFLKPKLFGQTEAQAIKTLKAKPELINKLFKNPLDNKIIKGYVKNYELNKKWNNLFTKYRKSKDTFLFSEYAFYEPGEFFAESFAMLKAGEKLPKDILTFINSL